MTDPEQPAADKHEAHARQLHEVLGLKEQFGDDAKVAVDDKKICIEFNDAAAAKFREYSIYEKQFCQNLRSQIFHPNSYLFDSETNWKILEGDKSFDLDFKAGTADPSEKLIHNEKSNAKTATAVVWQKMKYDAFAKKAKNVLVGQSDYGQASLPSDEHESKTHVRYMPVDSLDQAKERVAQINASLKERLGLQKDLFRYDNLHVIADLEVINRYENQHGIGSFTKNAAEVASQGNWPHAPQPESDRFRHGFTILESTGLKDFGDQALVHLHKDAIEIEFSQAGLNKLRPEKRMATVSALGEQFLEQREKYLPLAGTVETIPNGSGAIIRLPLKGTDPQDLEAGIGALRDLSSRRRDDSIFADASAKATKAQYQSYEAPLSQLFPDASVTCDHISFNAEISGVPDAAKRLPQLNEHFKKRFGFDRDVLTLVEHSDKPATLQADLSLLSRYDYEHGEGAFTQKFQEIHPEFANIKPQEQAPSGSLPGPNDAPATSSAISWGGGIGALLLGALGFMLTSGSGMIVGAIAAAALAAAGWFAGNYLEKQFAGQPEPTSSPTGTAARPATTAPGMVHARDGSITAKEFEETLGDITKASPEEKAVLESLRKGEWVIMTPEAQGNRLGSVIYAKNEDGVLSDVHVSLAEGGQVAFKPNRPLKEEDTETILKYARSEPTQSVAADKTHVDDIVAPLAGLKKPASSQKTH